MVNRRTLFDECVALMKAGNVDSPEFDTMCIFEDMLGEARPMFSPLKNVPEDKEAVIRDLAKKRAEGQPLQYLLGQWEFYGYPFKVGKGVLIPRPDTETIVDAVIDKCREERISSPGIADLCAGSGCIGITLKKEIPEADVTAFELSGDAIRYLRENTGINNADIDIVQADVLTCDTSEYPYFDIIVSNPPYLTAEDMASLQREVRHEPELALYGGDDGLLFYRNITKIWRKALRPGGWIFFESGMGQHSDIEEILTINNFCNINFRRDTAGIIRTVSAQKTEE